MLIFWAPCSSAFGIRRDKTPSANLAETPEGSTGLGSQIVREKEELPEKLRSVVSALDADAEAPMDEL